MNKVIIIAEAGVNHNGNIDLAYKLIDAAAAAGVDYIKFQTFITELIVDKTAKKAEYQKSNDAGDNSQFDMIKSLELSFEDFHKLNSYCISKGIKFLTSVSDLISLEKIDEYNLDFIKVASGEITNSLFLKKVSLKNKPIILSTGMANLGEIETALNILLSEGIPLSKVTILHCSTEYPTPFEDVNLLAMKTIEEAFKVKTGYSDHTLGIEIPIAAVALGAKIIEKHFTLDKTLSGPDHSSSLEPNELLLMVKAIRNVERALSGSGIKEPSKSEIKNMSVVRKSLFTSRKIIQGEVFSEENVITKRPGDGIPASEFFRIIGNTASHDIDAGIKITYKDVKWED